MTKAETLGPFRVRNVDHVIACLRNKPGDKCSKCEGEDKRFCLALQGKSG